MDVQEPENSMSHQEVIDMLCDDRQSKIMAERLRYEKEVNSRELKASQPNKDINIGNNKMDNEKKEGVSLETNNMNDFEIEDLITHINNRIDVIHSHLKRMDQDIIEVTYMTKKNSESIDMLLGKLSTNEIMVMTDTS